MGNAYCIGHGLVHTQARVKVVQCPDVNRSVLHTLAQLDLNVQGPRYFVLRDSQVLLDSPIKSTASRAAPTPTETIISMMKPTKENGSSLRIPWLRR